MTKKSTFTGFFLILFGLAFIIVAVIAYVHYENFEENGIKTTATITRIDVVPSPGGRGNYDYHVYVSYEIDGQQFQDIRIQTYTESMYVGKEIAVYYMLDDYTSVEYVEKSGVFSLAFGLTGLIIFLVGAGMLVSKIANLKK